MKRIDHQTVKDASVMLKEKCVITGATECCSLYLDTFFSSTGTVSIGSSSAEYAHNMEEAKEDNQSNILLMRDGSESKPQIDTSTCEMKHFDCVCDSSGKVTVLHGQYLTLDGVTGRILLGDVPRMEAAIDRDFNQLLKWTDQYRRVDVLAKCDMAEEVEQAMQFGAEGIGMLRIENMYVKIHT
jgi:phosphoenolpyruvate synthase/pyruvate phosphate dikinase